MIALRTGELAELLGGRLVPGLGAVHDPEAEVSGSVQTDSRLVEEGSIFFALPGAETDGHRFAAAAAEAGAALVVAERELELPIPQILVPSGVEALQTLAREVVARVRALGRLRVAAVTGSNGKTTTKNLLEAVLAEHGPTVAPVKSFNNEVGAPVTFLRVDEGTDFLVAEMGASYVGDIARLIRIVTPDVGIVLKVGMAHAGEFGGIEQTQRAKSEMVTDLPPEALAVLNADDPRVMAMASMTRARVVTFGAAAGADLRAVDIATDLEGTRFTLLVDGGRYPVRMRILGEHHVANALATLAVAREFGLPLEAAIARIGEVARAERGRMELLEGDPEQGFGGVTVIDDAYNASPDSMAAALKTLAALRGEGRRTVAVLGEMSELGEFAQEEHDRIGRLAVRLDIGQLVVVGDGARHIHLAAAHEGSWDGESRFVPDAQAAYDLLSEFLRAGDVVLVKSSNSAKLRFLAERIAGVPEAVTAAW
ncbi:MAG: UDP-N-acetylmuramoyl-tripeptide--D-alanyl-D-alanine ligase [Actinomycetales bacterium]|nr:UDP-N-acetylmuramoyl-tripeptide--D-alanyl-D-alanine ligase [Actinomycetales bacterium]